MSIENLDQSAAFWLHQGIVNIDNSRTVDRKIYNGHTGAWEVIRLPGEFDAAKFYTLNYREYNSPRPFQTIMIEESSVMREWLLGRMNPFDAEQIRRDMAKLTAPAIAIEPAPDHYGAW